MLAEMASVSMLAMVPLFASKALISVGDTVHSFSHSRISLRPASNQYGVDNAASVWLVPVAWFPCS